MAKNIDVIHAFINGHNMRTTNLKTDGIRLINYNTVIAERGQGNDFIINLTNYSSSTTRIQNALMSAIDTDSRPMSMKFVYDIKKGADSLI